MQSIQCPCWQFLVEVSALDCGESAPRSIKSRSTDSRSAGAAAAMSGALPGLPIHFQPCLSSASRIRARVFSAHSGAVLNGPWMGRKWGSVAGVFRSGS